jgi:hypothetical protein
MAKQFHCTVSEDDYISVEGDGGYADSDTYLRISLSGREEAIFLRNEDALAFAKKVRRDAKTRRAMAQGG